MKKLLFIVMLFPFLIFSQKLEIVNGSYQMQQIYTYDSIGKNELFSLVNAWIATNYKSSNDVIQLSDKDAGKIIAKGNFSAYIGSSFVNPVVMHTLTVNVKDNKVRITINNYRVTCSNCQNIEYPLEGYYGTYSNIINKKLDKAIPIAEDKSFYIINSINLYIKSNKASKNNDW